jgi:hypothetical protein
MTMAGRTKHIAAVGCVLACALMLARPGAASVLYLENFNAGTALSADSLVDYGAIASYWTSNADQNGNVVKNTGSVGSFGSDIPQDASGSGYFLFEGTAADSSATTFFVSSSIAVAQNTDYTLTFDLVNATTCNVSFYNFTNCSAQVQATVGGNALGTVSAAGDYSLGNQWQQFSFNFNSGSNTSVSIQLDDKFTGVDGYGSGTGNDFGVDDISLSTAPEPSTLGLFGAGALLAVLGGLKRRKRPAAA